MAPPDRRVGHRPLPALSRTRARNLVVATTYLVLVPAAIVVLAVSAYNNTQANKQQANQNAEHIRVLHQGLAETCHSTTLMLGLVNELILYVQADRSNPRQAQTIDVLAGIGTSLGSLSACKTLERP